MNHLYLLLKKNSGKICFLLTLLFVLLPFNEASSKVPDKKDFPKLLATYGAKDFWFSVPPGFEDESAGYSNFVKIFVTSAEAAMVNVEIPVRKYSSTAIAKPNDVIEFNIPTNIGQPFVKHGQDPAPPDAVFLGVGIHISADKPIIAYCVARYHWSSDGFLIYPVSSLGKEYIVAGFQVDPMFNIWDYKLPNTTTITAAFDDTKLSFTLGGNSLTKTTGGLNAGEKKLWVLNKGDVLTISTANNDGDLSGSKVVSTKPVAVVTGNNCANVPVGNQWCDYIAEMDLPTDLWGKTCHVSKIPNRKFASIIEIFAKEPNTKIYRNGNALGSIQTSGGILGKGYISMRMTPDLKPGSIVMEGDKPINVVLYNCGVQEDGYPAPNSDPFQMVILPDEMFQKEITFCTPGVSGGQGYAQNYINLVYETDQNGMMPDDMEFAGPPNGGNFIWQRLNTKFTGADDIFKKDVYGRRYACKVINLPGDGVYKIRAINPFGCSSFGFSDYDSYGYTSYFPYTDKNNDYSYLTINPPEINYGVVTPGTTETRDFWIVNSNDSMAFTVQILDFQKSNTTLSFDLLGNTLPFVINPRDSIHLKVSYTPENESTMLNNIGVGDSSWKAYLCVLKAGKSCPVINVTDVNLGTIESGINYTNLINVFNVGNDTLRIDSCIVPANPEFSFTNIGILNNCRLAPGSSILLTVKLKANATDHEIFDSLVVFSNTGGGDSIGYLRANVFDTLSIFSSDVEFKEVLPNSTESKYGYIQNICKHDIVIYDYTKPSQNNFTVNFSKSFSPSNPLVLRSGGMLDYTLSFTAPPQILKTFKDSIIIHSNANFGDSVAILKAFTITGINDETEKNIPFNVSIDKANNHLFVRCNNPENVITSWSMIDVNGNHVFGEENLELVEISKDLSTLANGVYILNILTKEGSYSKKLNIVR